MPRFLIARTVPPLKEEEIKAALKYSQRVAEEMVGVKWLKSYYSAKDGKLYCEFEAPTAEAIYEHGRRAQVPVDSVSLISDEFDSNMFK
jgi:hypothetical protein